MTFPLHFSIRASNENLALNAQDTLERSSFKPRFFGFIRSLGGGGWGGRLISYSSKASQGFRREQLTPVTSCTVRRASFNAGQKHCFPFRAGQTQPHLRLFSILGSTKARKGIYRHAARARAPSKSPAPNKSQTGSALPVLTRIFWESRLLHFPGFKLGCPASSRGANAAPRPLPRGLRAGARSPFSGREVWSGALPAAAFGKVSLQKEGTRGGCPDLPRMNERLSLCLSKRHLGEAASCQPGQEKLRLPRIADPGAAAASLRKKGEQRETYRPRHSAAAP